MDHKDVEQRLRAHQWPEIPSELRQRVMSAAVIDVEHLTWSDRVWFSRAWRLAAAAAVVVIVALDQSTGVTSTPATASPQVVAEAQAIETLAQEAGLSAQTAAWLAQRSIDDALRPKSLQPPGPAMLQTFAFDTKGGM
jgi:hypothetical protein